MPPMPDGRTIRTRYRVLQEKKGHVAAGNRPAHRAHPSDPAPIWPILATPLVGDGKYGKNADNKKVGLSWQALYSYRLRFAFTEDAGRLNYLQGKTFTAGDVWFLPMFEKRP